MGVEIGWQHAPGGINEVWLMDRGQWVCKLFEGTAEAYGERRAVVREWAERSDSIEEFLEMMHLEGLLDLDMLRRLLSEHAPLRGLWDQLREFCSAAGDIGEYPVTQIFVVPQPFPHEETQAVLPQEYVSGALKAWTRYQAGDIEALRSPNLGMVLGKIGVLVGQRLGLEVGPSVHFGDWLVEAVTGWSMAHGNEQTITRMEDVASQAAYGKVSMRGRAFCTPHFWADYHAAIPAVVEYLQGLP
jgi:hypothetical protein